jgi:hypothetical protein
MLYNQLFKKQAETGVVLFRKLVWEKYQVAPCLIVPVNCLAITYEIRLVGTQ